MTDIEFWRELRSDGLGFPNTQSPPGTQNRLGEREMICKRDCTCGNTDGEEVFSED